MATEESGYIVIVDGYEYEPRICKDIDSIYEEVRELIDVYEFSVDEMAVYEVSRKYEIEQTFKLV